MQLIESLMDRLARREPVAVVGGNTKGFLGGALTDTPVSMSDYAGVLNYEPTELVLTAKAGTRLAEIESVLADQGQMLPFEPPSFGEASTLGGVMATGLSGPRRVHLGSARDAILGVRLINGLGQHLKFGGEVMKNVAGYDISRLSVGAYGTLGILTEISVKVLPMPEKERTQVLEGTAEEALATLTRIGRFPYPMSAATWVEGRLYVRLSGAGRGVDAAAQAIGGETLESAHAFWHSIRHQAHPAFHSDGQWLWRLSVPPMTPAGALGETVIDWAGGQRWVHCPSNETRLFATAKAYGGHATCFARDRAEGTGMQPLEPGIQRLNERVREAMDPHRLINRGRLNSEGSHAN